MFIISKPFNQHYYTDNYFLLDLLKAIQEVRIIRITQ